jgi:alpha-galactosidase
MQQLRYTLAATFLGLMCLSGDIARLTEAQLSFVKSATQLYKRCVPVIRDGRSRIVMKFGASWRHPRGWQGVVRSTSTRAIVVLHSFKDAPSAFAVPLPGSGWRIVDKLT